jgi:hypothetical protein
VANADFCHSHDLRAISHCERADAEGRFRFEYSAQRVSLSTSVEGYESISLERAVGRGESAQFGDIALQRTP